MHHQYRYKSANICSNNTVFSHPKVLIADITNPESTTFVSERSNGTDSSISAIPDCNFHIQYT